MPAAERSRMKRHARIGRAASGARNESAAPLGCNLDADQSALERNVCTVPIDIGIVRGQALLGTSQSILGAEIVIAKLTDPQLGDERRMSREYAKIAPLPRQLHFHGFLAEQLALRRDNYKLNGIRKHLRD